MTERIKELFEQAANKKFPTGVDKIHPTELERFAELIVRECITITSECSGKVHPDDLIQLFREHFGVQE